MYRGEGPGPHTRDGCAVELYLRVPYYGEVEVIAPSIPGPDVLELGCAVGRMTRHLVFERYDPAWLANARVGPLGTMGDVRMQLDRVERARDHVEMSLRYRAGAAEWVHHFRAVPLDDEQARACLLEAGFDPPVWIDNRWGWATGREDT